MIVRSPPVLVSIQAARSMTRVTAAMGGSCRWVSSATCPAAWEVHWYSSPTTSSACWRDTDGGGGLNRLAARAATSQSISALTWPA